MESITLKFNFKLYPFGVRVNNSRNISKNHIKQITQSSLFVITLNWRQANWVYFVPSLFRRNRSVVKCQVMPIWLNNWILGFPAWLLKLLRLRGKTTEHDREISLSNIWFVTIPGNRRICSLEPLWHLGS